MYNLEISTPGYILPAILFTKRSLTVAVNLICELTTWHCGQQYHHSPNPWLKERWVEDKGTEAELWSPCGSLWQMQANKADTKPIVHVGKTLVLTVLDQASPRLEEHFLLDDLLSHISSSQYLLQSSSSHVHTDGH